MTLLNCCNILKIVKKMVVSGVVDMRQLLLKLNKLYFIRFLGRHNYRRTKIGIIEIKRSKNIKIKTYYPF